MHIELTPQHVYCQSSAFGTTPSIHLWNPSLSRTRANLLWGQAYIDIDLFQLSFCCFAFASHCFIALLTCRLCLLLSLFCLLHGMAGRCHACLTSWATVKTSGILHIFYSAFELTSKVFYPKSFTFSSRKSSCDMYPVQPNELPDKVHSTASICSPKETTLCYVHGRVLILLSRGRVRY